jgi:hypothetical protein
MSLVSQLYNNPICRCVGIVEHWRYNVSSVTISDRTSYDSEVGRETQAQRPVVNSVPVMEVLPVC